MKKPILHIIIFALLGNFLHAQIPVDDENSGFIETITEQVFLYTDRDMYLSGEEVWFTTFVVVNNTSSDLSKVLYLELFDASEKKLFAGKYEITGGNSNGNFSIPAETSSGNYSIRAYTQFQRNLTPETFTTKIISIINPEFPLNSQVNNPANNDTDINAPERTPTDIIRINEVSVKTDKSVYGRREPVELNIKCTDIDPDEVVDLSISIARQGTIDAFTFTDRSMYKAENDSFTSDIFWVPETRGVSISGKVIEKKSGIPLAGINIYLSVLGSDPQFHITKTKANGAFVFSLGYLSGGHEIFIGVKQQGNEEIKLLVNNDFSNEFPSLQKIPLAIDTSYKSLLEEMLVNHQSQTIFAKEIERKPDSTIAGFDIFGKADISVYLSDYINLEDLQTVFSELVHTTSIKNKSGRKTLSVLNPETFRVSSNELFLLDHVPIFNFEALLSIPPFKVKNIDVINRAHYLGDNTLESVVMMNTYAGDFAGYFFPEGSIFLEYQAINPAYVFNTPVYENQSEKNSRLPDFRTTLYWNPKITLSGDEATVNFYTSDNSGEYDVVVRGVTRRGEICFRISSISIE